MGVNEIHVKAAQIQTLGEAGPLPRNFPSRLCCGSGILGSNFHIAGVGGGDSCI